MPTPVITNIAFGLALSLASVTGLACGKQSTRVEQCTAETTEFRRWLRVLITESNGFSSTFSKDVVKLPRDARTERPTLGRTLRITDKSVTMLGPRALLRTHQLMQTNDESWQGAFHAELKKELQRHPTDKILQMQIAPQTPWRAVRKMVDSARVQGIVAVMFVFRKPTAVSLPPPSKVDSDIQRVQRQLDTHQFKGDHHAADLPFNIVYKACAHTWAAAQHASTQQRPQKLMTMANAVVKCGCTIDLASAKAVHWWMSGRLTKHREVMVGVRLSLVPERGAPMPIAAPDLALWSETYTKVLAAAETGRAHMLVADTPKPGPHSNAPTNSKKEAIHRHLETHKRQIKNCYDRQLLLHPNLKGTVYASFTITQAGNVTNSTATGVSETVSSCIAKVIRVIQFPKPKNGDSTKVIYPFSLSPK